MSEPVCYVVSAEDMKMLRIAATYFEGKDQKNPPKLGELKAEVLNLYLDRAVPVTDAEARRMLPQFYGTKEGKSPERTYHWVQVCTLIDKSSRDGTPTAMLLSYAKEQRDLAKAEGFDDTATYIQHVIDDAEGK